MPPSGSLVDALAKVAVEGDLGQGALEDGQLLVVQDRDSIRLEGDHRGIASGLIGTAQQVGMAVGLAILVNIAGSVTRVSLPQGAGAVIAGYHQAFVIAAAISFVAAIVALIVIKRPSALPAAGVAETVLPPSIQPLTAAAQSQLLLARCGPLLPPVCVEEWVASGGRFRSS